jgi:hypothetical protein
MGFFSKAPGGGEGRESARRKVALTLVISTAMVLMAAGTLTVLSPPGSRINLWFLFPAVCAVSGCFLASGLSSALVRGRAADALHTGIQVLTLALLMGVLAIFFPNAPKGAMGFGLLLILTGLVAVAAYLANAYSDHYWLMGRAVVVVLLGLTLEQGIALTPVADLLRGVPLMVAVVVGGLSLIGVVHEHSNKTVRLIGRFFRSSSNMITIMIVLTLVFVYALKLRSVIAERAPDQTLLGEWIVLAIVVIAVVYKFFSFFRSRERQQAFCDTHRLVQSIYRNRGDTGYAQRVVDQFIVEGRREPLVVLLTTALVQGRVDPYQIERIIGGVVGYTNREDKLVFRWALGDEGATTREERTRIAFQVLDQTAQALGAGHLVSDRVNPAGSMEG